MSGGTRVTRNAEALMRERFTVPVSPRSLTKPCSMAVKTPRSSSDEIDSRQVTRS
jgi:hypothetical protein